MGTMCVHVSAIGLATKRLMDGHPLGATIFPQLFTMPRVSKSYSVIPPAYRKSIGGVQIYLQRDSLCVGSDMTFEL